MDGVSTRGRSVIDAEKRGTEKGREDGADERRAESDPGGDRGEGTESVRPAWKSVDTAKGMQLYRKGVREEDLGRVRVRLYEEVGTEQAKAHQAGAETGPEAALKVSAGGVSGDCPACGRRRGGDLLGR